MKPCLSVLSLVGAVLLQHIVAVPANGSVTTDAIYYCPFSVSVKLTQNLSFVEIQYSASQSQSSLFAKEESSCYVRLGLIYQPTDSVDIREVEYKGDFNQENGAGEVETKVVWYGSFANANYGPVRPLPQYSTLIELTSFQTRFPPVTLSNESNRKTATNSTSSQGAYCVTGSPQPVQLHVHTTFKPSTERFGTQGSLTQRLKLAWYGLCGRPWSQCSIVDINGDPNPETCKPGLNAAQFNEMTRRPD